MPLIAIFSLLVGGESSKGSNSDIEVLEHPQDESLETIDSDNTDTEAKTPIPG